MYVWDESQTDGEPLAEISMVTGDPGDYTDRLKGYVAQLGAVWGDRLEAICALYTPDGSNTGIYRSLSFARSTRNAMSSR